MDKQNIFCSNKFHMDTGDVLHILIRDLVGAGFTVNLNDGDGSEESVVDVITTETVPLLDYDGNEYTTVIIGSQEWIIENLKVTHYANGVIIPNLTVDANWIGDNSGAYSWYDNNIGYKNPYGALYNWYAIKEGSYGYLYNWYTTSDIRNICSAGWHVPTYAELTTLVNYIDPINGELGAGAKLKESGTIYWDVPNTGTNDYGFNFRGGGVRNVGGIFSALKETGRIWCQDESPDPAYGLAQASNHDDDWFANIDQLKYYGLNIRLIKDVTTLIEGETGTYVGNDGKVYNSICIGTQELLSENLAETKYRNGDDIPLVENDVAWAALVTGAYCIYSGYHANLAYFTRGGIQEVGWRVPIQTDYDNLVIALGGSVVAGGKIKEAGITHWLTPNTGATNSSGFTALPAGNRSSVDGSFNSLSLFSTFWLNDEYDVDTARSFYTGHTMNDTDQDSPMDKNTGYSVRCVRDI